LVWATGYLLLAAVLTIGVYYRATQGK
jgi:hypothetical protein